MLTKSQNAAIKKMNECWLIEKLGTDISWDLSLSGRPAWVIVSRDERRITVNCHGTSSHEVFGSFARIAEFCISTRGRIYQAF